MAKLKLGPIEDDKPVKLTIELPAAVHRDLIAYARAHAAESGLNEALPPERLIILKNGIGGNEAGDYNRIIK